jgi:hypothetical protein
MAITKGISTQVKNRKQMSKQTAVKFSMYQWLIGNTRRYCNSCNQIQYHSCDQLRGYTCKCGANKLMDYFLEKYK